MVAWFRDNKKIFTFIKGRRPAFTNHTVPGAEVDMTHSNEREVLLTNMDVNATGDFYCEVSTEVPSIYTKASEEVLITVYKPQRSPPKVTGLDTDYAPGQRVSANCTSVDGHPPPAITWLLDDIPVDESQVVTWVQPVGSSISGSSLSLVMDPLDERQEAREVKVTCVASHPPYTGPLEYVDIQRKEITVSVMKPQETFDNTLESISSSSAAANAALRGRPVEAVVLLAAVGCVLRRP
ncbi:hemicentin-2-like isoform X2 [Frankliniella occidentalis]|nr:hemicentin-2-like isoform X2 [Frankliniella occidentalis]